MKLKTASILLTTLLISAFFIGCTKTEDIKNNKYAITYNDKQIEMTYNESISQYIGQTILNDKQIFEEDISIDHFDCKHPIKFSKNATIKDIFEEISEEKIEFTNYNIQYYSCIESNPNIIISSNNLQEDINNIIISEISISRYTENGFSINGQQVNTIEDVVDILGEPYAVCATMYDNNENTSVAYSYLYRLDGGFILLEEIYSNNDNHNIPISSITLISSDTNELPHKFSIQ